ncbi:MAG: substrate-binding domain-containing protein [Muribaculaceae bacterium]|nr:substrate-binding domain-containing protein [Muribaculaceae bacterium]
MKRLLGNTNKGALTVLLILLMSLCGCKKQSKEFFIGVSQCSDDAWRQQMNDEINREILFHEDLDVEIRSAGDNTQRQIQDIEYFIDKGADLIIVAPNEAQGLTPVIRKVRSKGIPVIIFDRNINDTIYTTFIDLDNTAIGEEAGRLALNTHFKNEGKVAEITGLPGSTPAEERHKGFISSFVGKEKDSFIGSFHADWNAAPAHNIADSLIKAHPDLKVIYAHNDIMAIAASKAARENGRNDITIIGTDGVPDVGIKAVADSLIDVTFTYPTVGEEAVKLAVDILNGKKVEKITPGPATTLIDKNNASLSINLNDLLKKKTDRISNLNRQYFILSNRENTQKALLYATTAALLLLLILIACLLHFIHQKNHLQKEMEDKNRQLIAQHKKQEELYSLLEEATRSKLAFFTNISHDLRTPLALIADPVEKIAGEKYLPPHDRTLMKIVVKNVKILRRMMDQILDFRKYQTNVMDLHITESDIVAWVKEWVDVFREYAAKRDIKFSLDIESDHLLSPPDSFFVAFDREKMERIIFNLLSNAFKFTKDRGEVKVILSLGETRFRISVCDNGTGMAEKEKSKIFDRFYQVDAPRPKGSGIGLSLTKAFVEMMDGTIDVESVPGEGSCFTVDFPVTHTEVKETEVSDPVKFDTDIIEYVEMEYESEVSSPEDGQKKEALKPLLLVIDDNADIRALVKMMLSAKYDVIEAADGKEGLRMAIKYVPDVIICDIMMPDMDGLEATRRIKEEKITSHIPVLILTACQLDEQRVKSYDSGADAFISKPFTKKLLEARCDSLITNRKLIYDLFLESTPENPVISSLAKSIDYKNKKSIPQNDESSSDQRRQELDNAFYAEFMAIVRKNYSREDLNVGDIAAELGIGATQLTRKIKAITNSTPVEIIRNLRLRIARKRLLATDESIAEIAYSTGFSTPQYFARCFKMAFNMTPSELRQSVK